MLGKLGLLIVKLLDSKIYWFRKGKKALKGHGMRWDTIVGIITLLTVLCFGIILYTDISRGGSAVLKPGKQDNTMGLSLHDIGEMGSLGENNGAAGENNTTGSGVQNAQESSAAAVQTLKVNKSPVVVIDAAHGGDDDGTVYGGNKEKDQTLAVANAVKTYLEKSGAKVVMTRSADKTVANKARTDICNSANAVVVLSIQRNSSSSDTSASGAEAWVHTKKPAEAVKFASSVLDELNGQTGIKNRGVKTGTGSNSKDNYYINAHCSSTSCVLQLGFMTNSADDKYVTSELDKTAKAIADGTVKYLKTRGY